MSTPLEIRRVGIVGAGRFGRCLGLRLRDRFEVAVHDVDVRRAKQYAKQNELSFLYDTELFAFADLLVLCVPADQVAPVLRRVDDAATRPPLCVNTATSVNTPDLVDELSLRRTRVIGLKPIGQYTAISHRLPMLFVTAAAVDKAVLEQVFGTIGEIRVGEERQVRDLNRTATRLALRFCLQLRDAVLPLAEDESWARSALCNVAVGTILDFPPADDNDYTRGLLQEIAIQDAQQREGCLP